MNNMQLLCTFCEEDTLERTLQTIKNCYKVAFDTIYVLENSEEAGSLCCTYNVVVDDSAPNTSQTIPPSTISLHRKKQTNTLYTINALNKLIAEKNGGKIDKSFMVDWEELRNTILVTQYGYLKRINTKIRQIVKIPASE